MCVCMFVGRSFLCVLAAEHGRLMGRQIIPMSSSLPDVRIRMNIALYHISGICPVEIDRLKMFVRWLMAP